MILHHSKHAATELFWIQYVQQVRSERPGCEWIACLSMLIPALYTVYSIHRNSKNAATGIKIQSFNCGIFENCMTVAIRASQIYPSACIYMSSHRSHCRNRSNRTFAPIAPIAQIELSNDTLSFERCRYCAIFKIEPLLKPLEQVPAT